MGAIVRKSGKGLLLLVIGAIFGPLIIAVVSAGFSANRSAEPWGSDEASRLVNAYRERLPAGRLFLSLPHSEDGRECGYSPEQVFPDMSLNNDRFTDYGGYWYMDQWRNSTRDAEYISAITQSVDDDLSEFEAGFLRRCIESTLFSALCMEGVSGRDDKVKRHVHGRSAFPLLGYGVEDQIVCTFVDGVAARQGLSLVDRTAN